MIFVMVKSTRCVDGPCTTPLPALPGRLTTAVPTAGFAWKQAVLNHCCSVCAPPEFGSHRTFGRFPATAAGLFPKPAASKLEVVIVKGSPEFKVTIPDACQPPSVLPTNPSCDLKNGNS